MRVREYTRWPSIRAVSFGGLVLAARIAAQQPTPPRAAAVAVPRLQRLTTPNVTGLSLDSARRILTVRKLIPQVETRPRGLRANTQDIVTQQAPAAGQAIPANRTVVVEVTIVMPNVIGQNISQAREVLATRGIRVELRHPGSRRHDIGRDYPSESAGRRRR